MSYGPHLIMLHCSDLLSSGSLLPPYPSCLLKDSDAPVPEVNTILVSLHLVPTSHCDLNSKASITVQLAVAG